MTKRTRFTALFDPAALARVRALAAIRQAPVSKVLDEAVAAYLAALSEKERIEAERLVKLWEEPSEDT